MKEWNIRFFTKKIVNKKELKNLIIFTLDFKDVFSLRKDVKIITNILNDLYATIIKISFNTFSLIHLNSLFYRLLNIYNITIIIHNKLIITYFEY